jgi:glycerol-3-phosphate dehydrogenase (NAD(P)+)
VDPLTIAVVGAGSWGTALAAVTADKGVDTTLWARREELAESIASRHENPEYLTGIQLPTSLQATHDLDKAVSTASIVVMAVPSHAFRGIFR